MIHFEKRSAKLKGYWQIIALLFALPALGCRGTARIPETETSAATGFFSSSLADKEDLELYCPTKKTLFYHWGPIARLTPWLQTLGYTETSGPKPLTEGMMNIVMETANTDAILGKALYLADSPLATAEYGNQLLIVDIRRKDGDPACQRISDVNILKFVKAYSHDKNDLLKNLPNFVAYRVVSQRATEKRPIYYTLHRAPTRSAAELVTIRLPSPEDVAIAGDQYWSTLPTKDRAEQGFELAKAVEIISSWKGQTPTISENSKRFILTFIYKNLIPRTLESKNLNKSLKEIGELCGLAQLEKFKEADLSEFSKIDGLDCKP